MKNLVIIILYSLLLVSCGNVATELKDMTELQKTIERQFKLNKVSLNVVNGKSLEVTVINSPYNDSSDYIKQDLTDAIGTVCSAYMHKAKLTEGTVSFSHNDNVGLANVAVTHGFQMHLTN